MCGGAALYPQLCRRPALRRRHWRGLLRPDAFTGLRLYGQHCAGTSSRRSAPSPDPAASGRRRLGGTARRSCGRKDRAGRGGAYVPSDVAPAPLIPAPPFWGTHPRKQGSQPARDLRLHKPPGAVPRSVAVPARPPLRRVEYRHFVTETVEPKFYRWCEAGHRAPLPAAAGDLRLLPLLLRKTIWWCFIARQQERRSPSLSASASPRQPQSRHVPVGLFPQPRANGKGQLRR